jgi:hypothetical protein
MKPGTAKIMTEYPEVGKLYRVQYSTGAHVPASIPRPCRLGAQASQSGPGKTSLPRGNTKVDLVTAGSGPVHHFFRWW